MSDDDQVSETTHPLERAHRFFRKAAPVIRDVNDTIERHGGIDGVRDLVIDRANEVVKRVDEVVANAAAIEGEVVERTEPVEPAEPAARPIPVATPVQPHRSPTRWIAVGVLVAAATYGALRLQGRPGVRQIP